MNTQNFSSEGHPIILRPSPAVVIIWVILLAVFFNLIYFLVMVFEPAKSGFVQFFEEDFLILLILGGVQIIFSFVLFFRWQHEYYEIHDGVIFHHKGYFHVTTERIRTDDSEAVTYSQSTWGRMLHYGDIIIQFPSSSMTLPRVENPTYAMHYIKQATGGETTIEREHNIIESEGESN